jgi:hypothetical protein
VEEDPHRRGATPWRRRTRAATTLCCGGGGPVPPPRCGGGGLVLLPHRGGGGPVPSPRCGGGGLMLLPRRGGGGPAPSPRRCGGAAPWRRRTNAVEEQEPAAVAPHLRRGSGGRRDADARERQALEELQQQRPMESSSHRTAATLGELQQQLNIGELQQTLRDPSSSSLFVGERERRTREEERSK